ncbi:MAG: DUF1653 domain-containing protein [Anaplasmataceae bacterium]|nr:DUF1653 domain-containing protein [Anaplasmataceae bacterium]
MSSNNQDPLSKEAQALKKGHYRHFKGHNCEILGVARHSENHRDEYVVYSHDGNLWIRPLKMFLETVERDGQRFPRFKFLEE